MRTLIYCTAYAQTPLIWRCRYRRWVDAVLAGSLGQAQIVLVDDGSPVLPGWPDTDIVTLSAPEDADRVTSSAPVVLLRFANRLGRAGIYDFPGWYRSFGCGARYGVARGFMKIIHLESDAFIISERLRTWLRETMFGWNALWSQKYDFPEIALQMIGPDQLAALKAFTSRPYAELVGVTHETALPLTHVERGFTGERFGELEAPVPADADFCAQTPAQREPGYYWWLNGKAGPAPDLPGRQEYSFARDDAGTALLADGWARPEPKGTWMTHAFSVLNLPALPQGDTIDLVLAAAPHVQPDHLPAQRLTVQVNTQIVGNFDFPSALMVGCEIPGSLLRRDGTDRLRLLHPDAAAPACFGRDEKRVLALMLLRMSLQPRPALAG